MRVEECTIGDYLCADGEARVRRLTHCFRRGGQAALNSLGRLAKSRRLVVEDENGFRELMTWHLPWYVPNQEGKDKWDDVGTRNYTVAEYVNHVRHGPVRKGEENRIEEIRSLEGQLAAGLCSDVVVTMALDTKLNKGLIVDGCHRLIALALIAEDERATFLGLLRSSYHIVAMELISRWAHAIYPCDFAPFLQEESPNLTRTEVAGIAVKELRTEIESECQ